MKVFFQLFIITVFAFQSFAYEGVLDYNIHSGDRDWKMKCFVKGESLKMEIYLGETLYQSILRNSEGVFIADELSKQVFSAEYEQKKWGKMENLKKEPKPGEYEIVGDFQEKGFSGKTYSVRRKGRKYFIDVIDGMGSISGLFLDQFSSLEGIASDGIEVFRDANGMPLRIYKSKRKDKPILKLLSSTPGAVEDTKFIFPEDYIRAKIRFRMR
jgi:hypothetical protein